MDVVSVLVLKSKKEWRYWMRACKFELISLRSIYWTRRAGAICDTIAM
jgi:hypothetical protein